MIPRDAGLGDIPIIRALERASAQRFEKTKASPCGGGVGVADGGGSDRQVAVVRIFDPETPPTDRFAIASPTGGGFMGS